MRGKCKPQCKLELVDDMSDKRPTIKAVLYTSKKLKNGEHPIMLRVNFKGSRKYKSLGISCLPKYWNTTKSEVRGNHPEAEILNKTIETAVNNAKKAYLDSDNLNKPYSAKSIIADITKEQPRTKTLYQLFEERIQYFRKIVKAGNTADGYKTLLNIFKKYLDGEEIELIEIDEEWIMLFEAWLRERYRDTSIKKFFDCFKAAMNYAVKKKDLVVSPLEKYEHIVKLNTETKKRGLDIKDITKLMLYYIDSYGIYGEKEKPVEEKCKKHYWNKKFKRRGSTKLTPVDAEKLSLALFLSSYSFQGLALVDLAGLKWGDIKETEILDSQQYAKDFAKSGREYADENKVVKECYEIDIERRKTRRAVKIVVEQKHVFLYLNPFYPEDDIDIEEKYVFPIYDAEIDNTEEKKYCRMKYATYLVNVNLKRIGERLGIPNITFYSARHSYASNLNKANVPHTMIAQNMGRSPIEIETYLKAFEQSEILQANESAYITGLAGYKEGKKERPVNEERQKALREWAIKRQEEEERIKASVIEEYGSIEAFNQHILDEQAKLRAELEAKFGDDTEAKIAYLKGLSS